MSGIDLTFPGPVPSRGDHRRRKIGLLGGSFNPAHDGHRHISLEAIRRLGLDEVWWLVSPQNPLKPRAGMLPLPIRIEKARHIARHPRIRVSSLESHLPSRFTADTLRALKTRFPAAQFVWLMGADNMLQIPHWYRWPTIFSLVPVAILDRGEYAGRALVGTAAQRFLRFRVAASQVSDLAGKTPPAWAFLRIRLHPASSTAIRSQRRKPEEPT
ncbi:nicotinate-nucleotide adenylyltransferase [Haematospirillum jordaniae]|uniref:nicotinate-nucleotide adenylyltransferase n=1 Tax=Haematospirillum jordaniae TaxID=1549855 RepID=UPI002AC32B84|nr:nicotinate-nucleotide adenylyltransferase [Haematospirillum jordaniae]